MSRQIARPRSRGRLSPRVKVWLETDGQYAFGFGLCEMLQAVDHSGSIKQAASDLGKSYRYIWGRLKSAEARLGQDLVEAHVGGAGVQRSRLTPTARGLVMSFLALRSRVIKIAEREFRRQFRDGSSVRF
jgi:molybdate transport system regulatory protein